MRRRRLQQRMVADDDLHGGGCILLRRTVLGAEASVTHKDGPRSIMRFADVRSFSGCLYVGSCCHSERALMKKYTERKTEKHVFSRRVNDDELI